MADDMTSQLQNLNISEAEKHGAITPQDSHLSELYPNVIVRRIHALKNLQDKNCELAAKMREEMWLLEKKYADLHQPLFQKRKEIVNGDVEPTDEEATRVAKPDEEEEEPPRIDYHALPPPLKGIPEFWLSAMLNNYELADKIIGPESEDCPEKERGNDEDALKYLTDISLSYMEDNPGYKLHFTFAENPYFTNTVLTKTYYMKNTPDSGYDDVLYDHSEGTAIDWKPNRNLTFKYEIRRQVHKQTKKVRTQKREVPNDTFFNFFTPPQPPAEEESDDEEIQGQLERDYTLGAVFKDNIIPRSVDWFTGQALQYQSDEDESEYDDEVDEDDENSDEDDD